VRPHVAVIDELPADYKKVSATQLAEQRLQIDPRNWQAVTDAMALVPAPGGTAASAHIDNVDFAGKTGSAQTMSNALAQRMGQKHSMNDNAWFVGFTPRRDPDIIVCVLFEGGEHGQFAARIAAQVIKAYVDKQRNHAIEMKKASMPGFVPGPGPVHDKYSPPRQAVQPKQAAGDEVAMNARPTRNAEFTGVWQEADNDGDSSDNTRLRGGRFQLSAKPAVGQLARAAPGMDSASNGR